MTAKAPQPERTIATAPTLQVAVTARIGSLRVRAPAADGTAFAIELLLETERGPVVLVLSADDLRHLVEQAGAAMDQGDARPI